MVSEVRNWIRRSTSRDIKTTGRRLYLFEPKSGVDIPRLTRLNPDESKKKKYIYFELHLGRTGS